MTMHLINLSKNDFIRLNTVECYATVYTWARQLL